MTMLMHNTLRRPMVNRSVYAVVAVLQLGCSVVFISDVVAEWKAMTIHTWVEALAVLALAVGAVLAMREIRRLSRRNQKVERELNVAAGAFQSVIEQHFTSWGLSKAERDVALLSIKGLTNAEIARMRDTREGTIKAQNAAIYRKAGVSSRAEMISTVIEDMISGMVVSDRVAA